MYISLYLRFPLEGSYPGMRIAVASSADTPFAEKVGRKALSMLEVLPGLTVWQMLLKDWKGKDVNQIGRQPPLSANKARTHFPRLKEATGVAFDKMRPRCKTSNDFVMTSCHFSLNSQT